jgi:methylated-DNA-[protein]-cysteine S-methyltransferase
VPNTSDILERGYLSTAFGVIEVVVSDTGLRHVNLAATRTPGTSEPSALLATALGQISEYLAGERRSFDLPLDLHGTEFQILAWNALALVPFGTTATYAQQAASIKRPTAVRAIGAANGRNPVPIVLPCHRIIGADGSLTGFSWGLEVKTWLLQHERSMRTAGGHYRHLV